MYDVASLNVSILLSFLSTGSVGIRPLKWANAPLTLELIGLFYSMVISPYYVNIIVITKSFLPLSSTSFTFIILAF